MSRQVSLQENFDKIIYTPVKLEMTCPLSIKYQRDFDKAARTKTSIQNEHIDKSIRYKSRKITEKIKGLKMYI